MGKLVLTTDVKQTNVATLNSTLKEECKVNNVYQEIDGEQRKLGCYLGGTEENNKAIVELLNYAINESARVGLSVTNVMIGVYKYWKNEWDPDEVLNTNLAISYGKKQLYYRNELVASLDDDAITTPAAIKKLLLDKLEPREDGFVKEILDISKIWIKMKELGVKVVEKNGAPCLVTTEEDNAHANELVQAIVNVDDGRGLKATMAIAANVEEAGIKPDETIAVNGHECLISYEDKTLYDMQAKEIVNCKDVETSNNNETKAVLIHLAEPLLSVYEEEYDYDDDDYDDDEEYDPDEIGM